MAPCLQVGESSLRSSLHFLPQEILPQTKVPKYEEGSFPVTELIARAARTTFLFHPEAKAKPCFQTDVFPRSVGYRFAE